jgi:hypothetical protein
MIKYINLDYIKYVAAVMVLAFVLSFGVLSRAPSALADQPLDVNCDTLATAIVATDDFLEANGIGFDSVGDILSAAILDDATFVQLSTLISLFSGGAVNFASPSETISTIAQCGLMPLLVDQFGD